MPTNMAPKPVKDLKVKLFADGAERAGILKMYENPLIRGFTTNPTLMRKAGITDYEAFAKDIVSAVPDRPLSLEVFADEFDEMERQALKISRWGDNVYTKIPVTNTRRESSLGFDLPLSSPRRQAERDRDDDARSSQDVSAALAGGPAAYVSVFAGRIADTGRDPVPMMAEAVALLQPYSNIELIWASPRELLNIFQADSVGCHIITATNDLLNKLALVGKDLDDYSLETVEMFHRDATHAGFAL